MFSTTQLDMLEPMVQAYYEQGYSYYLVHTNTNTSSSYNNYNFYDLTFYFSTEPIEFTNDKFNFTGAYKKINVITRNISSTDTDSKLDRLSVSNGSGGSVTVQLYEHIMTNAENSHFMNTIALTEYDNTHNLNYNIDVNDFFVPSVILGILVLSLWLKSWFGKTYKGEKIE